MGIVLGEQGEAGYLCVPQTRLHYLELDEIVDPDDCRRHGCKTKADQTQVPSFNLDNRVDAPSDDDKDLE